MANLWRSVSLPRYQQLRFLARFSQSYPERRPEANNTPLADADSNETHVKQRSKPSKINWKHPKSLVINSAEDKREPGPQSTQKLKKQTNIIGECSIDDQGNLIYTKMHDQDVRITKIMSSVKTKNKKNEFILLEGKRLIKEALLTGCKLEYILFSRLKDVEELKGHLPKKGGQLYKMPYRELQIWSDLTTNPGIMGIFQTPTSNAFSPKNALPLTIICDNVREPNNLGAIFRTSSGVGCEEILLTKGCVNVWESKVLRTACGAHFRLKISKEVNWADMETLLPKDANVFVADNNTLSSKDECKQVIEDLIQTIPVLPYFSADFRLSNHIVLIIGGETEGLSVDSYKLAKEFNGVRLNVPLSNGVESLNTGTALGIIAFEIKRQLTNLQYDQKMEFKC